MKNLFTIKNQLLFAILFINMGCANVDSKNGAEIDSDVEAIVVPDSILVEKGFFEYYEGKPFTGISKYIFSADSSFWSMTLTSYMDGLKDGLSVTTRKNGDTSRLGYWTKGIQNGVFKSYYDNGNLLISKNFVYGKEVGVSVKYHKNGKLQYESFMKDGFCIRQFHWDENGNLLANKVSEFERY